MNENELKELEEVIKSRKEKDEDGSYTCYLFKSGIDKILKKVGEECTETVIAAKNLKANTDESKSAELKELLAGEVADLLYHVQVMLIDADMSIDDVLGELERRSHKTGNKKVMKNVDKNT